jgi:hypothetical protein
LVILVLLGWVTPAQLREWRGYAIVGIFIVAAIITPPDVVSQLLLAIPMVLLYEVGIVAARMLARPERARMTRNPLVPAGFWRRYAAWSLDADPGLCCWLACSPASNCMRWATPSQRRGMRWSNRLAATMLHRVRTGQRRVARRIGGDARSRVARWQSRAGCGADPRGAVDRARVRRAHAAAARGLRTESLARHPGQAPAGPDGRGHAGTAPSLSRSLLRNLAGLLSWLSFNLGHSAGGRAAAASRAA